MFARVTARVFEQEILPATADCTDGEQRLQLVTQYLGPDFIELDLAAKGLQHSSLRSEADLGLLEFLSNEVGLQLFSEMLA